MPTNELQVNEQQKRMIAGTESNRALELMLSELENKMHLNITVIKGYTEGYPNMEKQYKMDYCVVFNDFDNKKWLLKVTSTIRDRIAGTEYFAQNIRIIDSKADKKVEHIFVVVPDSLNEKEYANAKRYSKKISRPTYKSFLSDVVTINELRDIIINECMLLTTQGIRSNVKGKDAEKRVVQMLNDKRNWHLWNDFEHNKHQMKSDSYTLFKIILEGIEAESSKGYIESADPIIEIEATDNIPMLKGGGFPKTDVSFKITTQTKKRNETYNISIKRTDREKVSVHEGDVSDLVVALNLATNSELAAALAAFQKHGSVKKMQESQDVAYIEILEKELSKHNNKIVEFVLFGVNSPRVTHQIQIANCMLFIGNKPDECSFFLRDKYVEHYLNSFKTKGQFGTPFQWTYPSKKRGKSFQLKGFTGN